MKMNKDLTDFVAESNRIEGILREPTDVEIGATLGFLNLDEITVADMENLVDVYQPGIELRRRVGMDVRVGNYYPAPGGRDIKARLKVTIDNAQARDSDPYRTHLAYEALHPFMDGNGRSGRALWLWQMTRRGAVPKIGFLHTFYYQTLAHS